MTICKTLVDKKNKIIEDIKLHSSIQFIEHEPETVKKIISFINKNEKLVTIKVSSHVLGSGSFGVVYEGTLEDKRKIHKVAIKIKKITAYDDKISEENEVKMQEKIYRIKKPNGDNITPRVFVCAFICSSDILSYNSQDICEGIQVIIMEKKIPLRISKLNFDSVAQYTDLLVNALKNYDILVNNGIYMYDIKPQNNVIEIQKNGNLNVQVIDTDPEFIYQNFKGSYFQELSTSTFKKIFLIITQMMYMIHYIEKTKAILSNKYYKIFLKDCVINKYISNLLKKFIGYFSVIYNFLKLEKYSNDDDIYFSKTFFRYTIEYDIYKNKSRKKQLDSFIKLVQKMFPIDEVKTIDSTIKKISQKRVKIYQLGKVKSKKIPKFSSSQTDS